MLHLSKGKVYLFWQYLTAIVSNVIWCCKSTEVSIGRRSKTALGFFLAYWTCRPKVVGFQIFLVVITKRMVFPSWWDKLDVPKTALTVQGLISCDNNSFGIFWFLGQLAHIPTVLCFSRWNTLCLIILVIVFSEVIFISTKIFSSLFFFGLIVFSLAYNAALAW